MNYLTLENIKKSYGDKILFTGLSMFINEGQKIALIARNGTGKTTLLQVIAGLEGSEGENAKIQFKKDLRIEYLTQEPEFNPEHTVMDAIFASENPVLQAVKEYESALLHPENEDRMQKAMNKMEDHEAWDMESKVKEILTKLKIGDFELQVKNLSGGQVKRLALAKVLISEPELLILDEPTNHLDMEMIEWLENYLQHPGLTLLLVTHDRYFLENVCNQILELENGNIYKYAGNYSEYLEKKNERAENDGVVLDKNRKLFLKELDWVRRMPQARSTKAKSRIDKFDELKQELSQQRDATMLQINIKANRLGSKIIEAHNIGKAYDGKKLFSGFSYKFKRFDRVGIIGPNGTGKSTFLQIITGGLIPDDGKIVIGETVVFGYYTQSGMKLKEDRRVIDVITDVAEYIPTEKGHNITAASLLEKFMFPREQQQVFASQLSGGEKRRLYLLTILMANPNFLILDEPTNDLDLVTLNVLEEFLTTFQGCVVLVSHDRYFMDKLVDHLFVFGQDNKIIDYPGNYTQYRAYLELEEQNLREAKNNPVEVVAKPAAIVSYEDKKEIQKVEREIKKLEEEKASITEKFNDMTMSVEDIQKHSTRLKEVESQIEEKEMKWMELVEGV
ncbi:MAG: ABC-F family ATP-binding cassette domain-containing protein [Saprospiraceae bacterium]|jgi:ATP-binding cassette subfamily F protein uup|uniref:ABC-F family ATP-binding cassette domain-containing protein n=1 Tax=Candidatus Brachybacter algidus TaxID=2982024 RepID=UPI001B4A269A|nr:ABC-F family ATP-binding cassette domain-containing protein [Candidatus Brachybacter algidus]MBP7304840.1 ABC-F family ATP-binding cassette domain-containing protein [Saprospiraceae bacterium]MBK6371757.1 ABC-F family ATP-binding cassette domain-containing protein [Candidatus Brachybacter algidus]MBK6448906.1 ABC-F family ATP-binding cassette domain-containing protein [Candidatus Brachybacter algidus]MBK7603816.1 ABC-F family ATP-binding cassette domain-containing protein [Candidatus Brachyb